MVIELVIAAVCLVVGCIIGSTITKSSYRYMRIGKLRMDDSTGDPYLFLELSVPVEAALEQKEVVMEVDLTPIIPDTQD